MKYILRVIIFNIFSLWLIKEIVAGLILPRGWFPVVIAGLILSFLMIIVKPILKILFIPVNILTFGLLSWIINVFVIYLLTILMPEVQIVPWLFPGFSYSGFTLPEIQVNYLVSLISVSLGITLVSNFLHGISEG